MAKKRYRVYRDGGQTGQQPSALNKFVEGGMTSDDQQMQLIMQTIYSMIKDEGLDKTAVFARLQSTGLPSDFLLKAIDGVYSYMNSIGESFDVDDSFNAIAPSADAPEQPTEDQGDDQMQQMQDMSMEVASEDDDEALDIVMSDEMRYGGEPNQYQGLNKYFQAGGEQTEQQEPVEVYFPNMDIMTSTEDTPYMKKGGMTKKKFMKNILKRFEEGGEEDENVKLESADKKDTPEGSVKKYTQGFLGAIKNKATTAETEKLYKLAKQSGDPKLMQILGENPEQGQGQPMQPQQPMAKYGMQKYQDEGEVTNYNLVDNNGNIIPPDPNYIPPGVPTYPDFSNWDNMDRGTQFRIIQQMIADPTQFNPEDIKKYGPQKMTQEQMDIINRENANRPPVRISQERYGGTLPAYQKKGEVTLDDYINTLMDFETRRGSRTGGYLPNYGINIPKYTDPAKYGTKYDYLADGVSGEEARKFIMDEYYNEGIENFDPSVAGRLIDYRYNTGRNYKDFLLLDAGLITLDEIASGDPAVRTKLDNLWTTNEAKLISAMDDEGYLKHFDQTRDELAKDYQARMLKKNPNYGDPYGKSWHDRSTIYSGLDYAKIKEAEKRGLLTKEESDKLLKEGTAGKDYILGTPSYEYITRGQDPSYYGYHNMFEFLFPGNFNYPGGQKYTAPSSWGKPVARDVYKTRSMGWNKGQPKKWIEYYEVPEGMNPEDMKMITPKGMRKAGRELRKNLKKAYRRDGAKGAANVFRNAMNAVSGKQGEEDSEMDPTSKDRQVSNKQSNLSKTELIDQQLMKDSYFKENWDDMSNKEKREARRTFAFDNEEYRRPRDKFVFGAQGTRYKESKRSRKQKMFGGELPKAQVGEEHNMMKNLAKMMTDPTNPILNPEGFSQNIVDNANFVTPGVQVNSSTEAKDNPVAHDHSNPDFKFYEHPGVRDEKKKKQYVGFKNRSKNQRRLGRDAQLGLFNNASNMALGVGEDINQNWNAASYVPDNLGNVMDPTPMVNQRGDYTTQGDFRPDEQGYRESANNPGFAKYGGALRDGDVRELTLDEIRKIMDEGGLIEFI